MQVEAIRIPSIDPVLAQQFMNFLKQFAGPGTLPSPQVSTNPTIASSTRKIDEMLDIDDFFHPLLGSVMTGNDHDMLTKLLKPLIFFLF